MMRSELRADYFAGLLQSGPDNGAARSLRLAADTRSRWRPAAQEQRYFEQRAVFGGVAPGMGMFDGYRKCADCRRNAVTGR